MKTLRLMKAQPRVLVPGLDRRKLGSYILRGHRGLLSVEEVMPQGASFKVPIRLDQLTGIVYSVIGALDLGRKGLSNGTFPGNFA